MTKPNTKYMSTIEQKKFLNKASYFLIWDNLSKVFSPLLVFFCAALFAGGPWGQFKYYEALMLLAMRFCTFGLDKGLIWYYSQVKESETYLSDFSKSINLTIALSLAFTLGIIGIHLEIIPWFHQDNIPISIKYLSFFLGAIPLQILWTLLIQSLINKRILLPSALVKNIIIPFFTYGTALLLYLTPFRLYGLGMGFFLGNLLGSCVATGMFIYYYKPQWNQWSFSIFPPKKLLLYCLPLASTESFMAFTTRLDLLLLAQYTNISTVETYSVIVILANLLRSIRQSFDNILLSIFSEHKATFINSTHRQTYNYANWLVMSIQIPILVGTILFGDKLLGIINPAYSMGYHILLIAMFLIFINTPNAFTSPLIMGLGKTYILPIAQACFIASGIILNFLFIPKWGGVGAALATGISSYISGLVNFLLTQKFSNKPLLKQKHLIALFLSGLIYSPCFLFIYLFKLNSIVEYFLFFLSSGLFYLYFRKQKKVLHEQT